MKRTAAVLAALVLAAGSSALASGEHRHGSQDGIIKTSAGKDAFAEGEIKKVDKGAGKVTIKHGPLVSLDMPPMTMVFRVKDPAMLDQLKKGDNVRFKAEKIGGNFTVTELQPAK